MCHKKLLHLLVIHFPPLIVTTSPGGGEMYFFQTVVAVDVCSVPVCDTVAPEAIMVASVGVDFQTPVGAASRIVLC